MESDKSKRQDIDSHELERIFGLPNSPRTGHDVHLITNEKKAANGLQPNRLHRQESEVETIPTQPLLEPDKDIQKPPLAGPEIDDLDGDHPVDRTLPPYPGIDDGLLEPVDGHKHSDHDNDSGHKELDVGDEHGEGTTLDGNWWRSGGDDEPDFPDHGFGHERPISPFLPPGSIPDVNTYQQKKNLAQGMMDLALLSANANQLRYVLESSTSHPYYYPSVAFISLSIILQIAVGIGLILNSRYDVKDEKDICKADKINNMTVLGVFLVTIVNVFITSFSVATPSIPVTVTTGVQQGG